MVELAVRPHLGATKVLLFAAWVCTLGAGAAGLRNHWKRDADGGAAPDEAAHAHRVSSGDIYILPLGPADYDVCASSPHSYTSELHSIVFAGCLVPSRPSESPCADEAPFESRIDGVTPSECADIVAASGQETFSIRRLIIGAPGPPHCCSVSSHRTLALQAYNRSQQSLGLMLISCFPTLLLNQVAKMMAMRRYRACTRSHLKSHHLHPTPIRRLHFNLARLGRIWRKATIIMCPNHVPRRTAFVALQSTDYQSE